ncbi:MAG: ABC transporter substrate-binding protein [Methylophaga sp.]|nr:MAG: ABC transporter substrate-binding protein [Methylophaga sp.]
MRRFWPLFLFSLIFVIALIAVKPESTILIDSVDSPQRIISLSPSITETLFALGLANKVVAVSDYCDFPLEANDLPKVGGLMNPSLEAIIAQQADLVILSAKQQRTIKQLQHLTIATLAVDSTTLFDIKETITAIGQRTEHQQQAKKLLTLLENKIHFIAENTKSLSRPTVMISLGNSTSNEQINSVYIAGQNDFYNDLITLAGGTNVYKDTRLNVPSLSVEGIIQLNPDIIIDIYPEADDHNADLQQVLQRWQSLKHINAVKNNRIYIIEESYATIPGPRVILLLEQFARLIHPEVRWDKITP